MKQQKIEKAKQDIISTIQFIERFVNYDEEKMENLICEMSFTLFSKLHNNTYEHEDLPIDVGLLKLLCAQCINLDDIMVVERNETTGYDVGYYKQSDNKKEFSITIHTTIHGMKYNHEIRFDVPVPCMV